MRVPVCTDGQVWHMQLGKYWTVPCSALLKRWNMAIMLLVLAHLQHCTTHNVLATHCACFALLTLEAL